MFKQKRGIVDESTKRYREHSKYFIDTYLARGDNIYRWETWSGTSGLKRNMLQVGDSQIRTIMHFAAPLKLM